MNQLEYMLAEIKGNGRLSQDALTLFEQIIADHLQRMQKRFPNYALFTTGTGQSYGLMMEKRIIASFSDLTPSRTESYDACCGNLRVEIKSIKCTKGDSKAYIGSRIVNLEADTTAGTFGTGSFQQVKPAECNWFLFHLLYGNAERLFLIPSKMFSATPGKENQEPGKLLLSRQHRDHPTEGQANLGTILDTALVFEIKAPYDSSKVGSYSFLSMAQIIIERLDKIGWHL